MEKFIYCVTPLYSLSIFLSFAIMDSAEEVSKTIDSKNMNNDTTYTLLLTDLTVLHEMATVLNTGLDRKTVGYCISLCEKGANPEALAVKKKKKRNKSLFSFICLILFYRQSLKIYRNNKKIKRKKRTINSNIPFFLKVFFLSFFFFFVYEA